jgi:hypothetical protein
MSETFRHDGPLESPGLNRGGYLEANGTAPNQVVAVCQVSAGSKYADAAVIAWPVEAYGHGPQVHLNPSEASCIRLVPPAPGYKSFCYSATLKYHMDGKTAPPVGVIPNSAAYNADAQDGCKHAAFLRAEPDTVECLFDLTSDMLRDGCVWGRIDGHPVKLAPVKDWPHGPVTAEDQAPDGAGWFAIRDYGHRQEGRLEGTGSFLPFQSMNDAGVWGDWVMLNGGLIDRTAGREQGDLDILWHISGRIGGVAGVGDMSHVGGPEAAFQPILDGSLHLGLPDFRWRTVYAQALDLLVERKRLKIGGKIVECDAVKIGGKWARAYEEA